MKYLILSTVLILLLSCSEEEPQLNTTDLIGTWELEYIINIKTNDTLTVPDVQLVFFDNCVKMFTTLNCGKGGYSINGNMVSVPQFELSERDYNYNREQEEALVWYLNGKYEINRGMLRISSNYQRELVFRKNGILDPYRCDFSNLLVHDIETGRYYPEDIMRDKYASLYGKWFLVSKTGGFSGGTHYPEFDFLEFKPHGIYGIGKKMDLLQYGKVEIEEQTESRLKDSFHPENETGFTLFHENNFLHSYRILFNNNDSISIAVAGGIDAFRYNFVRVE